MSSLDLLPDLAERLDRLVPVSVSLGNWDDVRRRVGPAARVPRHRLPLGTKFAIAAALFVLLAGIATATYLVLRHEPPRRPQPGALTIQTGGYTPFTPAEIVEVLPNGRLGVLWRCPSGAGCAEMTSVDWAPDGRRVAFTLDGNGGNYLGLHILDRQTGHDLFIPYDDPRLGCRFPNDVAWSPDGRTLAYGCDDRSRIFTIRRDGTGRRRVQTGLPFSARPTWSPDGKRIAFEGSIRRDGPSSIYVIGLDGARRVLVARHASLPDWSPDGKTIAYRSPDGIRLVTPAGVDVTPHRNRGRRSGIALRGAPAWSPDGSKLAVAAQRGVYVVGRTGTGLELVTSAGGTGTYGPIRPAWYPDPTAAARARHRGSITTCC